MLENDDYIEGDEDGVEIEQDDPDEYDDRDEYDDENEDCFKSCNEISERNVP